jgi:hypothetical protein
LETEFADNVLTVRLSGIHAGWEQYIMLVSDQHHDSPYCNRKLEKAHLDKAMSRDALIFFGGDTFDAMQGKHDPRATYDHLDPALLKKNYFDAVVKFNTEFYKPYAKNIVMIGVGNHEASVSNHYSTGLIDRLVEGLSKEDGANIQVGGYGGWVRFLFTAQKTRRMSLNLKYFHGSGGEAPVSKGLIQNARQAVFLPDADILWGGHNHQDYVVAQPRERLSSMGKIFKDVLWFIRTPGYNDSYGDGSKGWEVESGLSPKPAGCVWLRFYMDEEGIHIVAEQDIR